MTDAAQVNRSLNTIRTELQFLVDSGAVQLAQLQSILAQLPGQGGAPSSYVDPRYLQGGRDGERFDPSIIAQQAQDPANAAHPQNPQHHDWAKKMISRFGNAAMFGAGATFGGDMVNDALRKF